jgi:hypothetical protein
VGPKARSLRLPFDGMRPLRRKGKGGEVPQEWRNNRDWTAEKYLSAGLI